ncbi:MAG: DUF6883 domain-containing protein [Luteolibacter sp.]|uniref:DUF6883 domain-containing protein n=1 Tax=Luteolibacter sp. TaxID=1962973 RepID=UPI0032663DCF
MKLPFDSLIARTKITHYLLVPQTRGDKSGFLKLAGYDSSQADQLIHDLRMQILVCEAVASESTAHGQFYEISCPLVGPNGRTLDIRTIWMKEHLSGQTKFITLIPERSR